MICKYPDCDGGYATGYCHDDCREAPQQWHECDACDGNGYIVKRITVYEHGCGFPHDDGHDVPCERCHGKGGWIGDVEHNARVAMNIMMQGETVEWATPQKFFADLDAIYNFTLDAAASHENAKCEKYFTIDEDGLSQSWASEVVWLNPPYSRGPRSGKVLEAWLQKAYAESRRGAVVVCLVPVRSDTKWWHDWVLKGEVQFVRGRLKFVNSAGDPLRKQTASVLEGRHGKNTGAPFPSAIVIFRPSSQDIAR